MKRVNQVVRSKILAPGQEVGRLTFVVMSLLFAVACGDELNEEKLGSKSQSLVQLPARIEAENFDRFQDSDTVNQGDCGSGAVDREFTQDPTGSGCNVGWTTAGEWLEYDVSIDQASTFDLVLRVSSAQSGQSLRVEVDGQDVSGAVIAPAEGWQSFEDRTVSGIPLASGSHVVRIIFETGNVNLDYIDVIDTASQNESRSYLIQSTFESGAEGFTYTDDLFAGTNAPNYASGVATNGQLEVQLGGQDDATIEGMSGGFSRSFSLPEASEVTVSFDYVLEQSCYYESDEVSEVKAAINNVNLTGDGGDFVSRVTGNGSECPGAATSGTYSTTLDLEAGSHVLSLGGHNNKKTFNDELTTVRIDNVEVSVMESEPPAGTIIDADFSSGLNGFGYVDDAFRGTSAPSYADGVHQNGRLEVTLGGQDNTAIYGTSGGFVRTFTLAQPATVSLELEYSLAQSCAYETDEQSEMLVSFDGTLVGRYDDVVDRVVGNGNDCPGTSSSGLFFHTMDLAAGTHTIMIGGYNDKKTAADEVTTAIIENVLLTTDSQCVAASASYANLCGSCGGSVECDGTCSASLPLDLGAPCGECGGVVQCDGSCSQPLSGPCPSAPTAEERLEACARDPRVVTNMVSPEICAGADLFFRETFEGNGRTCGSCHPVANNYTIDPEFVAALHDEDPLNPLFVNEFVPELAQLETSDLREHATILENVDGFQDPANRFVSRSVPHLFSLSQTISVDPNDSTTSPPVERTGWSGDGAPGDGSLNAFLEGAINQHFTRSLERVAGVDFRLPTQTESDLVEDFQLSLGRQAELDLASVRLSNETAETGRQAFMDPLRATCGVCHSNAGANFSETGFNRNIDNGIRSPGLTKGSWNGQIVTDGGFGGADLENPNVDPIGLGEPTGFGNLTFNPPSLIEAADTPPFFHSNAVFRTVNGPTLADVTQFYGDGNFQRSTGKAELDALFGPAEMMRSDLNAVVRLLHVLNAAFNIDLAVQRLHAVETLAADLGEVRSDVQVKLLTLAGEEIEDAIFVLSQESLHPELVSQLDVVLETVLDPASQSSASVRALVAEDAAAELMAGRGELGSNIDFVLGPGTLMF